MGKLVESVGGGAMAAEGEAVVGKAEICDVKNRRPAN
jgi:hypothetical protein